MGQRERRMWRWTPLIALIALMVPASEGRRGGSAPIFTGSLCLTGSCSSPFASNTAGNDEMETTELSELDLSQELSEAAGSNATRSVVNTSTLEQVFEGRLKKTEKARIDKILAAPVTHETCADIRSMVSYTLRAGEALNKLCDMSQGNWTRALQKTFVRPFARFAGHDYRAYVYDFCPSRFCHV